MLLLEFGENFRGFLGMLDFVYHQVCLNPSLCQFTFSQKFIQVNIVIHFGVIPQNDIRFNRILSKLEILKLFIFGFLQKHGIFDLFVKNLINFFILHRPLLLSLELIKFFNRFESFVD